MSVWLGLNAGGVVLLGGYLGLVVHQSRHLLLLHQGQLVGRQPEVLVLLEQLDRPGVGVLAGHDGQRQLHGLASLLGRIGLEGQNVLDVQLRVGHAGGGLGGQADLDAGVPQPLPQPAGHQDEARSLQLLHAQLLKVGEFGAADVELLALGDLRHVALERVDARLALGQELAGSVDVVLQAAWVGLVGLDQLGQQLLDRLLVLLDGLQQVRLAELVALELLEHLLLRCAQLVAHGCHVNAHREWRGQGGLLLGDWCVWLGGLEALLRRLRHRRGRGIHVDRRRLAGRKETAEDRRGRGGRRLDETTVAREERLDRRGGGRGVRALLG
mmetsp:Transcript_48495/g.121387  ORF Transcript_48495/g.121387 Transcript_48495/m.121387 type:complete len:327 (-) Transcript_48495:230-1210(-)